MDSDVRAALRQNQVVDLTTTGRRTGEARRIEIFLHHLDGRLFITGMPRPGLPRAWLRNVEADPGVVLHLKNTVTADLPATARVVTEPDERRTLLSAAAATWGRDDLDVMMEHSPLIELTLTGTGTGTGTGAGAGDE